VYKDVEPCLDRLVTFQRCLVATVCLSFCLRTPTLLIIIFLHAMSARLCLSVCLSVSSSVCISVSSSVCMSLPLSVSLSLSLSVSLSLSLSLSLSIRSETVEHEVLPAFSPRLALTFWASGQGSLARRQPRPPSPALAPSRALAAPSVPAPSVPTLSVPTPSIPTSGDGEGGAVRVSPLSPAVPTHLRSALTDCSTFKTYDSNSIQHSEQRNIFVNIASYRDTECKRTIIDLFLKAEHPDNIFVGTPSSSE
jgi:hypothetical protein